MKKRTSHDYKLYRISTEQLKNAGSSKSPFETVIEPTPFELEVLA